MNHLIILSHPSTQSFSHLLHKAIERYSVQKKWQTVTRDLYQIGFNPVLTNEDLNQFKTEQTPSDILYEQELIAQSQLITFIFPLWWAGFPAIMKGYIDRVFSYNFAYKAGANGIEGLLKGKKVILLTSMGNSLDPIEENHLYEAFRRTMGYEIFSFCGLDIIEHRFYAQITNTSMDDKNILIQQTLNSYKQIYAKEIISSLA